MLECYGSMVIFISSFMWARIGPVQRRTNFASPYGAF